MAAARLHRKALATDNGTMVRVHHLVVVGLIAWHLVFDWCLVHFAIDRWSFTQETLLGVCASQTMLIAIWMALGPGSIVVRVPWGLFLGVFVAFVLAGSRENMPFWAPWYLPRPESPVEFGSAVLGAIGLAAMPLFITRRIWGWRIARVAHTSTRFQFNLAQVIVGQVLLLIAVAIFFRHLIPQYHSLTLTNDRRTGAVICLGLANFILAWPCAWAAFKPISQWLWLASLWVFFALLVSWGEACVIQLILQGRSYLFLQEYMDLLTCNFIQGVSVFCSLTLLRLSGLQFITGSAGPSGNRAGNPVISTAVEVPAAEKSET